MSKFLKLFHKNIKTQRLEMRVLGATKNNASMIYDILKHESPEDFQYIMFSARHRTPLPKSKKEILQILQMDTDKKNTHDVAWYVFHQDKLIGYQKVHYFEISKAFKFTDVWFIKSAWGNGFNQEIHKKLESIAFEKLKAHSAIRECMDVNVRSEKSIRASGYHLDGCLRECNPLPDGTWANQLVFTKLHTEYTKTR